MMPLNKQFTNPVTRSVLEIREQKRSGFVFPSTDRVSRLVNRYHWFVGSCYIKGNMLVYKEWFVNGIHLIRDLKPRIWLIQWNFPT